MLFRSKGRQVAVTGPVTARAYIGNDGNPHCSMEIQDVKELEYLGGKPEGTAQSAPGGYQDEDYSYCGDEELPI